MTYALSTYTALEKSDQTRAMAKFRSSAQVTRDIAAFKQQLLSIKSPEDLLKNRKAMTFVLSAYGLDSEINYLGRIKAVLNSDLANQNSIANRLSDRRYRELAGELQVATTGVATLKNGTTIDKIVERYIGNEYEKKLGEQDVAVREARYFAKNVGKVSTVYEILGDPVLRTVVTDTLGLPPQFALRDVESQAEFVRRALDITQFKTAATAQSQNQRANAQSDVTTLTRAVVIADAAVGRADEIAQRLRKIASGYDGLAALQDPLGANAAEVAVHTAAVPALARQRGLATAAETSVNTIADTLNRMSKLRGLAADPANAGSLADYKSEFASLAQEIRDQVATGADYRSDGADESLLDGSVAGPISTAISAGGKTVTLRTHDLSAFITRIDAADAAFAAVTDAADAANLGATASAISGGGPMLGAVRDAIIEDRLAADAAVATIANFTATVDTVSVTRARSSIADADSRAQQIGAKLGALRAVAASSAKLDPGADRTEFQVQAAALVAEINTLLTTPGVGIDNLLDGTERNYATTGGKSLTIMAGAYDSAIGTPLASANVDDAASAQALVDLVNSTLMPKIQRHRDQLKLDRNVVDYTLTVLDPRGKLDESVRQLATDLPAQIDRAASNGANLLKSGQPALVVQLRSATGSVRIDPQPGFQSALAGFLATATAQLPANLTGAGGAYEALTAAATAASDAAAALRGERREADSALLQAKRRLATAPSVDTAAAEKPTEFTKRFVQRFLAARDLKSASEQGAGLASTSAGAMLGLFS
ncbi:MAG: DUF1217 domain-containing protein [Alphaproteobacteria bacterium]|nr:DUF1217 domain-containing protein [Alphaproteobacteria bacterium]